MQSGEAQQNLFFFLDPVIDRCTHCWLQFVSTLWQFPPIRKHLCTNVVLFNPVEQTIKGEAGPVSCIITPPERHNEVCLVSCLEWHFSMSLWCHKGEALNLEGGLTCPHEEPSVPLWRKLQPPPTQQDLNMLLKHQLTSYHQKQDKEEEREWRRNSHEQLTDVVGVMSAIYCLFTTDATRNYMTQQSLSH